MVIGPSLTIGQEGNRAQVKGNFIGAFYSQIKNLDIPASSIMVSLGDNWKRWTQTTGIGHGVGEIESLLMSGERTLQRPWPADVAHKLQVAEGYVCMQAWEEVSSASLAQVLEACRNRLLIFILELSDKYPALVETTKAITQSQAREVKDLFMTNVYGGIHGSNVAMDKAKIETATVNNSEAINLQDLAELLQTLRSDLPSLGLADEDRRTADADFTTIEAQLAAPRPKYPIVIESLKSLKLIAESAGGNVVAAVAVHIPVIAHWINTLSGT